jgi:hypothetical protein
MLINNTYQFVTAGDYVNFFVNNNLQTKISKDSNIICWFFDDQPGIVFKVNGGTYYTGQPEDISFDTVPLGSKEGFVTAIKAMFPVYAGGGGTTPGIDDVLAEGQALTADRIINLNGKEIAIQQDGQDWFSVNKVTQDGRVRVINPTGASNRGDLYVKTSNTHAEFSVLADFNDATKSANISGTANVTEGILFHDADIHRFLRGNIIYSSPSVPATASSTGTTGQIAWDANFFYVCVSTNTWKRTALSTW